MPSLSLHYEVPASVVKFEAPCYRWNGRGWRLVSVLGGTGGPAPNGPEGKTGSRQEQEPTDQDRPDREGQEQRIVEVVFGGAEKGHQQDRNHPASPPPQECGPLGTV